MNGMPRRGRGTLRSIAAICLFMAVPGAALAGEVFGKILAGGSSVGNAATVAAACGDKSYPAQATDSSGSYHIIIGATGKCTLTVSYKGQSADLSIVSYEEGTQVDILLETKDGKLAARRK